MLRYTGMSAPGCGEQSLMQTEGTTASSHKRAWQPAISTATSGGVVVLMQS